MKTETIKDKEFVTSGIPPTHTLILFFTILAGLLYFFPSIQEIDHAATPEIFTKRLFPELISLPALIIIRILSAILILGISLQAAVASEGWVTKTSYIANSKLEPGEIPMKGWRTQAPYTSCCWNILGLHFALSGYIAHVIYTTGQAPSQAWLRVALVVWETAAPNTILVSAVVRYAIWPTILRRTGDTSNCKTWRALTWHNANVVFSLTEAALLGGLPVKMGHLSLSAIFGCLYILFTWSMSMYWIPGKGPHFIYFFFDVTLGKTTSIALVVLLLVLMVFYSIFAGASIVLSFLGGGLAGHLFFMIVIFSSVCRFRD